MDHFQAAVGATIIAQSSIGRGDASSTKAAGVAVGGEDRNDGERMGCLCASGHFLKDTWPFLRKLPHCLWI